MSSAKPTLLVYADEDYLLPLIIDEDGKLCKYEATDDLTNRLWLYFQSSSNGVFYDKSFKSRALYKESGFYCNLWGALTDNAKVMIGTKEHPFWDLLRTSSLIKEIKSFWDRSTSVNLNQIPTVFLFADSDVITDESKSEFMKMMGQEDFSPVSFSVSPSIPVCQYVQKEITTFVPSFGDNILFLSSVGETLRFSSAVFDGESFLTDGKVRRIENFGDAPLKNALVRYVVDAIDRSCGGVLSSSEKKEAEYRFQLRNADKWYNIRRESNGDFDVEDFRFSFDPGTQSPRTTLVKGSFLETEQENTVRQAIESINQFVYDVLGKKPSFVVFNGEAFEEGEFTEKILQKLDIREKIILTPNTFTKALSNYFEIFSDKEESLNDFKKIFLIKKNENKGVSEWINNASKIIAFEKDLITGEKDLKDAIDDDNEIFNGMMSKCASYLKKSKFKDARESLDFQTLPSDKVVAAKKEALSSRSKSIEMEPVYERIEVIGRARQKVNAIHKLENSILELSEISEKYAKQISERKERIEDLESKFKEYLDLKRKFGYEKDFRTRKSLLEQMRLLTEEDLPEISLPHVTAQLSAQIEFGGIIFKKPKNLKFSIVVEPGKELPCNAELHIATKSLTSVEDEMCYSFGIPKGSSGKIEGELKLPHQYVEPNKTIYLYLFPNEDVVDKNAIKADFIYVKQ